ncbi:MAG: hypothetical protein ACK5YK_00980 [Pseudomonadota bacterium]
MYTITLFFLILTGLVWAEPTMPLTLSWANSNTTEPLNAHQIETQPNTWQLEGLPFPGVVLWRPATAEIAYQHPTELSWLRLTPTDLPLPKVSPTLTRAANGKPWQTQPTRRWAVHTNSTDCGALFTIPPTQNVNASGLQSILALLHWLNIGETPSGCLSAYPNPAGLGLPTYWASPIGTLTLQNIGALSSDFVATPWPAITYPITPETRLRLLLSQLPVPDRARFIQSHTQYPLLTQIEKLSALLKARYGSPEL